MGVTTLVARALERQRPIQPGRESLPPSKLGPSSKTEARAGSVLRRCLGEHQGGTRAGHHQKRHPWPGPHKWGGPWSHLGDGHYSIKANEHGDLDSVGDGGHDDDQLDALNVLGIYNEAADRLPPRLKKLVKMSR